MSLWVDYPVKKILCALWEAKLALERPRILRKEGTLVDGVGLEICWCPSDERVGVWSWRERAMPGENGRVGDFSSFQ